MRKPLRGPSMLVGFAVLACLVTSGCATSGGPAALPGLSGVSSVPGASAVLPSQTTEPTLMPTPAPGQYTRAQLASFGRSAGSLNPLSGYSSGSSTGGNCGFG